MSWIKVDTTLVNKPKVVQIARILKKKREETLGFLVKFWCLVDGLTEDGFLPGYDRVAIDDLVGLKGFAKALQVVEWLEFSEDGCFVCRYEKHNGNSAKKRAEGALRKSRFMRNQSNKKVTQDVLPSALPREDKSINSRELIPGACACTPTHEETPPPSRVDLEEALRYGEEQGWEKTEVEKWWLWNDAREWPWETRKWRSALALWMKRARPLEAEDEELAKISAPPCALEMDVDMGVE